jgi:hypothetical protein
MDKAAVALMVVCRAANLMDSGDDDGDDDVCAHVHARGACVIV